MSDKKMKRFLNLAFKVRGDTEATEVMVATEVLIMSDLVKFLIYFNSSIEMVDDYQQMEAGTTGTRRSIAAITRWLENTSKQVQK